ncbi:ATP-binding protein [Streptomyces sp. NPDC086787]|uniref:ATP-binding protein n=1 Tax=Streptomyces sp. NPDC086787 TaxID=3365759 RepID=UPI0038203EF6
MLHGRVPGRDFLLELYVVGDALRIEVTDTYGERLPELQESVEDAETGRGLVLVEALADRWGVAPGRSPRKTVRAEVVVRAAPEPGGSCSGVGGGLLQGPRG